MLVIKHCVCVAGCMLLVVGCVPLPERCYMLVVGIMLVVGGYCWVYVVW